MHKKMSTVIILVFLFNLYGLHAHADKIFLKDGKNYEGKLIGKSDRRYLFVMKIDNEEFKMSFFPEDVERIELDEDTVESQIPFLKDVDTFKVPIEKDQSRSYELSLYKESQIKAADSKFSEDELKGVLNKQEAEYYVKFNNILQKYVDKFQMIQNLYLNLTTATREDFARAKEYMDQLYFELNSIFVPDAFKGSHSLYLESVKASYLAFSALQQGMLDDASKQTKISEDTKQRSMSEFRQVIMLRKSEKDKSAAQKSQ